MIDEKVRQREAMCEKEAARLKAVQDKTEQIFNKQFEEARIK